MFQYKGCRYRFVIQKHVSERAGLHYDIRLEGKSGGRCVLISFAARHVPRLVSGKASRIAIFRTDNHELSWMNFQGRIEQGYGKGTVEIWDRGTFEVLKQAPTHDVLRFHGKKMRGIYAIVKYGEDAYLLVRCKERQNAE